MPIISLIPFNGFSNLCHSDGLDIGIYGTTALVKKQILLDRTYFFESTQFKD